MASVVFTNNATSVLQAAITNAQTTLAVAAADAALFPAPTAGDWFPVTLVEGTKLEICQCTGRSGATLTIVRGQEGTTAQAFGINAQVDHRLTKNALQAFLQDAPNDGNAYVRQSLAWALGYSKTALDTSLAGKVAKAGDTMTGNLIIAPAAGGADLTISAPAGAVNARLLLTKNVSTTGGNSINGQVAGANRWINYFGTGAETGANVGSDYYLQRCSDAGGVIGTPIQINRATGMITLADGINVTGGTTLAAATVTGVLTLNGGLLTATVQAPTTSLNLGTTTPGTIFLRPQGVASATNQATLDSAGALSITGTITSAASMIVNDGTINHRVAIFSSGQVYTGTFSAHSVNQQVGNAVIGTWESGGLRVGLNGTDFGVGVSSYTSSVAGAGIILANTGLIVSKRAGTANVSNMTFMNNAAVTPTTVGSISTSGSATAFNTSSDENLKDFIGPYDPAKAIEIIRADPVRDFTWKVDGEYAVGWGAQTSYAISADLASPPPEPDVKEGAPKPVPPKAGEPGYVPWGMDQGKRTPYLWAALSWALDTIDELTSRIEALETA